MAGGALGVAVMVDDEWRRRGLVDGLREVGGIVEVTWNGPAEVTPELLESQPEVVVLGLDRAARWDALSGFDAATELRDRIGEPPGVLAIGPDLSNPLLAVRAVESGIRHLCAWRDVADVAALEHALLAPPLGWSPGQRLAYDRLRVLGVPPTARLSAGLRYLAGEGFSRAVDGGCDAFTRRRKITLRRRFADITGVRAVGSVSAAANQPVVPSWQQLCAIVDLARGWPGAHEGAREPVAVARVAVDR